jgi:branched-chain amino acid transport system ATP-binding protein
VLRCESLTVWYGPVQALDDVTLDVAPGECVALLGANGAGKTTLLRTISGLERPRSGAITLEGKSILTTVAENRVRAGLCHVPERRRIFPGLTVLENLEVATAPWRGFGASRTTSDACSSCSRGCASARPSTGGRSRAASSRCWPSGGP